MRGAGLRSSRLARPIAVCPVQGWAHREHRFAVAGVVAPGRVSGSVITILRAGQASFFGKGEHAQLSGLVAGILRGLLHTSSACSTKTVSSSGRMLTARPRPTVLTSPRSGARSPVVLTCTASAAAGTSAATPPRSPPGTSPSPAAGRPALAACAPRSRFGMVTRQPLAPDAGWGRAWRRPWPWQRGQRDARVICSRRRGERGRGSCGGVITATRTAPRPRQTPPPRRRSPPGRSSPRLP